jgi:hypothetical protein
MHNIHGELIFQSGVISKRAWVFFLWIFCFRLNHNRTSRWCFVISVGKGGRGELLWLKARHTWPMHYFPCRYAAHTRCARCELGRAPSLDVENARCRTMDHMLICATPPPRHLAKPHEYCAVLLEKGRINGKMTWDGTGDGQFICRCCEGRTDSDNRGSVRRSPHQSSYDPTITTSKTIST